ncbi:DUF397 domain-containing protein [Nocardiopsis baichengensis]|uniref:DUF397 domain-containing protein n=1 Tax=Nocardiopsis baichengensis TaxID=280240 RepID=UPI0009FD4620
MLTHEFTKSSRSQVRGECVAARVEPSGEVEVQDTVNPALTLGVPAGEWVALLKAQGQAFSA